MVILKVVKLQVKFSRGINFLSTLMFNGNLFYYALIYIHHFCVIAVHLLDIRVPENHKIAYRPVDRLSSG